ncbi:hypothetical protein [Eleftheria terrae]|uniref:hypothetical protein n=1 Tax=Eleftheria terrae TaxID=1597781 RepID=UPI00263BD25C|nr:hypothetical protein [Eleftheria terrae]WKB52982.1 hypothetical protein N7L95_00845 [Eleftheria terrae]
MNQDQIKEALRLADELDLWADRLHGAMATETRRRSRAAASTIRTLAAGPQQMEPVAAARFYGTPGLPTWERWQKEWKQTCKSMEAAVADHRMSAHDVLIGLRYLLSIAPGPADRPHTPAAQVPAEPTPIKGAWIEGGYVIVTPAKGTDPKALKAAIERAHGASAAAPAAPEAQGQEEEQRT